MSCQNKKAKATLKSRVLCLNGEWEVLDFSVTVRCFTAVGIDVLDSISLKLNEHPVGLTAS